MSPIKENTVSTQELSYRHHNKNRPKGDAFKKMHTKRLCIQTNFTRNINSVGFKWRRLSKFEKIIFVDMRQEVVRTITPYYESRNCLSQHTTARILGHCLPGQKHLKFSVNEHA